MIRATYTWLTTNEVGSILEWEKENAHLTPYHFEVIRNHAFSEFFPEEYKISCLVEVDNRPVAHYIFVRIPEENKIVSVLTDINTGNWIEKCYVDERCL